MLNLALIVGLWATTCLQSQNTRFSGFMIESYDVRENGSYELKREWYADRMCGEQYGVETEAGVVFVGKSLSGIFVSGNTYEADFKTSMGVDLGAVKIEATMLKIARGMRGSSLRNSLVGIFEYVKK